MTRGASLKACLDLSRVSNLPTVWTNVLAGSLLSGAPFDLGVFLLLATSLSCFYAGGMAMNDLCDRDYDRVNRPSRPIPSGRVSVRSCRYFISLLFAAGFILLAFAPYLEAVPVALLLLAAIAAYNLRHKQNPLSVVLMAFCRFLIFIIAAVAISGQVAAAATVAGGVQFCYIIVVSLVARYEAKWPVLSSFPVVPVLLAGVSLIDGILLAVYAAPIWLTAGIAGTLATLAGQWWVRGD